MNTQEFASGAKGLAVVTGASSGIGYELAKLLVTEGFDLMIVAEDEGISTVARELGGKGMRVEYAQIDLARPGGTREFYGRIQELGRPVEILAVNAGVGVYGEFADLSWEEQLNLLQLNVISAAELTHCVVKDMLRVGHGKVLITSSIAAEMPGPYYAVYAASKAFLQSFGEALHYELKDKGILVTSLQPGPTETEFFKRAGMEDTKVGQAKKDDPATVARDGYEALMAGKDHVVAGSMMNTAMAASSRVLSEQTAAKMQAKQMEPASPKH